MANKYVVCPVSVLLEGSELGKKWTKPARTQDDPTGAVPKDYWHLTYRHPESGAEVISKINGRGRAILSVNGGREIVSVRIERAMNETAPTEELAQLGIFAFDRNCYHVGYPMDLGDIEEYAGPCPAGNPEDSSNLLHCINCPLHNRIFDLATGDMMALIPGEDKKIVEAKSTGCYQRIHHVSFLPFETIVAERLAEDNVLTSARQVPSFTSSKSAKGVTSNIQDLWIVVEDSHGHTNPLYDRPKVKDTSTRFPAVQGPIYIPGQKLPSDSYNRPDGIQFEDKTTGESKSKKQRTESEPAVSH